MKCAAVSQSLFRVDFRVLQVKGVKSPTGETCQRVGTRQNGGAPRARYAHGGDRRSPLTSGCPDRATRADRRSPRDPWGLSGCRGDLRSADVVRSPDVRRPRHNAGRSGQVRRSLSKSSGGDSRRQNRPVLRQYFLKRRPEPHGQRSSLPTFSTSSLSPWTTRTPRLTRASGGKPRRRLAHRLEKNGRSSRSCWSMSYRLSG